MTTRERREARAERLRGWAEKREATASATLNATSTRTQAAYYKQAGEVACYPSCQ
jgi:hypothetical protein